MPDILKRIEQQSQECPEETFTLVGYSQGGMIVTSAAGKIPADLQKKVAAVVLYGAGNGVRGALAENTLVSYDDARLQLLILTSFPGELRTWRFREYWSSVSLTRS